MVEGKRVAAIRIKTEDYKGLLKIWRRLASMSYP